MLASFALFNIVLCYWCLPDGHAPDPTVSLRIAPISRNFAAVLRDPQFATYAFGGAFAFSGLLVYVAGSPIIFMEAFHVDSQTFPRIFAGLAVGFVGSNQLNVFLLRKYSSEQIFLATLWIECPAAVVLLLGTVLGWFGLAPTLVLLFLILSTLGLAYPNAAALALAPFDHNIGSASAMLGFVQIAVSGIASAAIGIFDSHRMLPVVLILAATSWVGLGILYIGRRWIPQVRYVEEKGAPLIGH